MNTNTRKNFDDMLRIAKESMKNSNMKKHGHSVGAAVLCGSGKIYGGCAYVSSPMDYCAERVALLKALSEGEKKIISILVTWYGLEKEGMNGLCGLCLNTIWQLTKDNTIEIILVDPKKKKPFVKKFGDLYPEPYTQDF